VRFAYYDRLSSRDQAIYRRSDAITQVPLPDAPALQALADRVRASVEADDRRGLRRAVQTLVDAMLRALEVPALKVRVLGGRACAARSELDGLFEREEGEVALVRVWMRTAAREQVVKFRTFLRTLLHELCHHLDYERFALADSFHTRGFFQRESSLMRQLAPATASPRHRAAAQLELPW